jgi:signal transduction histidine kinase
MIHYLITSLVDFLVALLALSKKNNSAAKALAFTGLCLGLWSLELFLLTILKDESTLSLWFHLTRWGMFFMPSSLALLSWRLVGGSSKAFLYFVVAPSFLASAILSASNLFLFPSVLIPAQGGFLPKVDNIFYLFALTFLWCLLSSIILGALRYRRSTHREKQRARWLLIVLFLVFVVGLASIYLVKFAFYLKFVGAVTNITFISVLFYATVQHNLMDVRAAVSVGLARAAILAAIVWLYFYVIGLMGDNVNSMGGIAAMVIFVVMALELYPRMLKLILPNAKKLLLRNSYEFDLVREDTERALGNTVSFSMMSEVLNHLFLKILRVNNYRVLLVQPDTSSDSRETQDSNFPPPFGFIADNHPLVVYGAEKESLIMADEIPESMRLEMEKYEAMLGFTIADNKKVLAIVLVGGSSTLSYYRYDDIRMFEWLMRELGHVLNRLIRLDQMQDQLGEAKKTLSMLGMMSHYHHDIKAPFAIIDGVFSNDIYDRDKQKDIVLAQVERGSRLIATMASILGGKRRRRVQPCEIEVLVKDCLFVFESSIDRVEYDLVSVPKVAGDAEDLKILFINLIKNASEARRAREEIVLTVKTWVDERGVFISIKDNGIGMNERQLENLWDQGYSDKKFGSGIGMQAIKRIADEHGVLIKVQSIVDTGTEFILHFPLSLIVKDYLTDPSDGDLAERRAANRLANSKVN